MVKKRIAVGLLLAAPFLAAAFQAGPNRNDEHRGWPVYGGGPENIHYSTLSQINRQNVRNLQVAWTFDTGDAFPGSEMECNPIVVDGVLFATSPKLRVIALDAATGKLKWSFDPNQGHRVFTKMRNRGVTFWSAPDGGSKRIFFVSRQYLYALDAETGSLISDFGQNGRIDLRFDLGRDPAQQSISDTSPPMVYKDLIILGSIVAETLPASPGDIRAYDARTGKLRWSFHTIPHPGEFGYNTWPKDAWQYIGGANNWSGMSLDVKRGIVYAPLGSASFDFYGANRLGDDLFANSLLALNAETGQRIWHFQTVRHDIWDRDLPTPPALVTIRHKGRLVDAAAQLTKSGYVFVFDRATGKPVFPVKYRDYPPSEIDGEKTAKTQPLPTAPPPFDRQLLTADMLTTRTPEAHAAVLAQFQKFTSAGEFIPPSLNGTILFSGMDGGGEWGGPAFDPETGYLYVNANEMAWILQLVENRPPNGEPSTASDLYLKNCATCHRADEKGAPPEFPSLEHLSERLNEEEVYEIVHQGSGRMPSFARLSGPELKAIVRYVEYGENATVNATKPVPSPIDLKYRFGGYTKFLDPDGYPAIQPPWGTLSAINLNTGKFVWQKPFGEYPELAEKGLTNTGSENYGGGVVTASGLYFIAATSYDKKMHAFDKTTGELLWETTLPAAGNATTAVYEVNGTEYVLIGCGGGKSKAPSGGTYVAFALPDARYAAK
ncbi:MAG: PQQ-binding-like beta-propeller repeat protein [Acidobacteriaceae bacterium]|nr:PQQ-binding-like beta-propeller repeat protein [Acidobacteriaceae bacterium]